METAIVCPSTTGTRLQWALTFAARGSTASPVKSPSIFCVSCCIFSSSPPMNGITLALMSMEATRVACAGDGLHGSGDDGRDAELLQRRERHREDHGGAVGIRHDHAAPAALALLQGNDLQ